MTLLLDSETARMAYELKKALYLLLLVYYRGYKSTWPDGTDAQDKAWGDYLTLCDPWS